MKIRCLTIEEGAHIVGMHQGGAKGVEIVVALGHSKSTMSTVLKEFEHRRSVERPKSIGRPRKLSERSVRVITRELVQDRKQTLVDITNRSGGNVSASIVKKALHDIGYYSRITQRNPSCLTYIELEGLSLQESTESRQLRIGRRSFGQMSPHLRLASLLVKFWFGKKVMNATNWIVSHLLSS
jgi:transposase